MAGNHNSGPAQQNIARAIAAWGEAMPDWVRLLAAACDKSSQRLVADRLGKSHGYVSRILNRKYAGSYDEAGTIVRVAYGSDQVECPVMGEMPLASCVRNRRRKGLPTNRLQHLWARHCPVCPLNTDHPATDSED